MSPSVVRYVSDAVVDVLRDLGCTYLPLNPGSSFRGLHDSLVNSSEAAGPQIILCAHEEIAVAASHAYAKATGGVAFAVVHDLVGLMHASMAVYDAWCDRTPLVILGGGGPADPAERGPIDWFHSANTQSALVRPFVKWDDDPVTPQAMLDGIVQAFRMAASGPQAPTYVTLDAALQEKVAGDLVNNAHHGVDVDPPFVPRQVEIDRATDLLMDADLPVVVAGRVGLDPTCTPLLVALSEALGAPCRDERNHSALPTDHPLNLNGDPELLDDADVILAVDLHDVAYVLNSRRRKDSQPAIIDLSLNTLAVRSWANAGSGLRPAELRLIGDPKHGLEQLLGAVHQRRASEPEETQARRRTRAEEIGQRHERLRRSQAEELEKRWDENPISVPRLVAEVYHAVKDLPWLLTLRNTRSWPEGVWKFDRGGRYLGHSGGGGVGYGPGALLGGGLAARDRGEFAVGIIGDGDLLFAPGALWSAVHYKVPMLVVVNNNQSYYNDEQHQDVVAGHRGRPRANAHIGTRMDSPGVDFGSIARGQGAWAGDAVTDPDELQPALANAVKQALHGQVALVDVHTGTR